MCKIVPNKPEPTKIKHLLWGFELKLLTEIPAKSLDLCFCSFLFFFLCEWRQFTGQSTGSSGQRSNRWPFISWLRLFWPIIDMLIYCSLKTFCACPQLAQVLSPLPFGIQFHITFKVWFVDIFHRPLELISKQEILWLSLQKKRTCCWFSSRYCPNESNYSFSHLAHWILVEGVIYLKNII